MRIRARVGVDFAYGRFADGESVEVGLLRQRTEPHREKEKRRRIAVRRTATILAALLVTASVAGLVACRGNGHAWPEKVTGQLVSVHASVPFSPGGEVDTMTVTGLVVDTEKYGHVDIQIDEQAAHQLSGGDLHAGEDITIERDGPDSPWVFVSRGSQQLP